MRREIISSKDTYEVNRASIVTDFDRKVLYRLYQPLVGYGAISLYFTLLSELEADMTTMKTSRPHSVIFDMMNCTNKDFTMFVQLLEGVGLVKFCTKALDTAEQKVKILQKDENGNVIEAPFAVKSGDWYGYFNTSCREYGEDRYTSWKQS